MFDQKKGRVTQLIFAVTVGLHLAAIYFSLTIKAVPISSSSGADLLTVLFIQAPENQPVTDKSAALRNASVPESTITAGSSKSMMPSNKKRLSPSVPGAQTANRSDDKPFASPAIPGQGVPDDLPNASPVADSMTLDALRNIGKIDRELRHAHPKLPDATPNTLQTRLEKGIGAAAKAGSMTMETLTLSDGRKMTKVTGPNGSYCAMIDALNRNDHSTGGVRTQVTTCPN